MAAKKTRKPETRTREELRDFFKKNMRPSEGDFADLIESLLNQKDDGFHKEPGKPLEIVAGPETNGRRPVLNLTESVKDDPARLLHLDTGADGGLAVTDPAGSGIRLGSGNVEATSGGATANLELRPKGDGAVQIAGPLTVQGTLKVQGPRGLETGFPVPAGTIVMWSGSSNSIPTGWALCDGNNRTPDLRNRFLVGAGGAYNVGKTGGAAQVTLTEAQMPSHKHTANADPAGEHSHTIMFPKDNLDHSGGASESNFQKNKNEKLPYPTEPAGTHGHTVTVDRAGEDQAHENRPPYYALCFIMKL
jgi:microcystin-dependent protein